MAQQTIGVGATANDGTGDPLRTGWQKANANFTELYALYTNALIPVAALTPAADKLAYYTGASTAALADLTSFGRSLIDDADAATARSTLGLGTAATVNTGTSGATIPLLNAANTWASGQVFVAPVLGTPASGTLTNCTGLPNASVVGLGTSATVNTGTSGATIPLLNGANTWGATQSFGTAYASTAFTTDQTIEIYNDATKAAARNGTGRRYLFGGNSGLYIPSNALLSWGINNFGTVEDINTNRDTGLARNAAGVVEVNSGTAGTFRDILARVLRANGVTFASLPGTPAAGSIAYVTDCNTTTWGATAAGSGSNKVLVWYNNANWTVIGI